jgi:hypothetical protein
MQSLRASINQASSLSKFQAELIYIDKTILEVFASDGLIYVPLPFIPRPKGQSVSIAIDDKNAKMIGLEVYKLSSIWRKQLGTR